MLIEEALEATLPCGDLPGNGRLNDAIRAAVYPAGKRLRPVFTLLAAQAAGVPVENVLDTACAVEFLHSSSLLFDDLPCMDNASTRRDRPALHVLFGESTALLAGLALMNEAYALLACNRDLVKEAARCLGANGMIGGQAADMSGLPAEIRDRKTTTMMQLTLVAGAMAGGAPADTVAVLAQSGERLGRAYQMLDDIDDAAQDRFSRTSCANCVRAEVEACSKALSETFGAAAEPLIAAIAVVFSRVPVSVASA